MDLNGHAACMCGYLFHDRQYSLFVISGEDHLQFFSTMHRMHLERKNVEAFVLAQLKVHELRYRDIGDDSAEVVQVSRVLAGRSFFLRARDELAFGDQRKLDF
jgi:hypothetical protein